MKPSTSNAKEVTCYFFSIDSNVTQKNKIFPIFGHFLQVKAVDEICKDLDFYIVNSDKNGPSVEEMEIMVKRHGGRPVKYLSEITFFVYSR